MTQEYAGILHTVNHPIICIARSEDRPDYWAMSEAMYKLEVGRRLRVAIEAIGETQAEVARELHVSPTKLGNWLRGDHYPGHWFLNNFCTRYGVTTDWILRGVVSEGASGMAKAIWRADQASQADREAGDHPAS